MTQYIEKKWFESLYFFIQIQREISEFKAEHQQLVHAWLRLKKNPLLFEKPMQPLPPKIRNITVVPLCDNKLKHIRFDHTDLLALLARWKLIPEEFGGKDGGSSMYSKNHFEENPYDAWNILFDMKNINELKRPNQQIHRMIMCDSVSASVLFETPKREKTEFNRERIKQKLEAGDYTYIIPLNVQGDVAAPQTVVWHRDIVAAKCIMLKGLCLIR
ncbi:uncharacterized protein LOC116343489 [Contarinia nasturtii]|uniref:uncharacterized protein LOC116343489 n=1 Tax=Contarinia nasturtii TaxID=265458 RepID=UPI0012D41325|nr:uncharacterized protein LOC116343489 [Contarinia nasturtii]